MQIIILRFSRYCRSEAYKYKKIDCSKKIVFNFENVSKNMFVSLKMFLKNTTISLKLFDSIVLVSILMVIPSIIAN